MDATIRATAEGQFETGSGFEPERKERYESAAKVFSVDRLK